MDIVTYNRNTRIARITPPNCNMLTYNTFITYNTL